MHGGTFFIRIVIFVGLVWFVNAMHIALGSADEGASAMINQKPLFPRLAGLLTPH